jgi:hypothetical protein
VAARTAQLAFFIVQFMAAAWTPAPIFANLASGGGAGFTGGILRGFDSFIWFGRHYFVLNFLPAVARRIRGQFKNRDWPPLEKMTCSFQWSQKVCVYPPSKGLPESSADHQLAFLPHIN